LAVLETRDIVKQYQKRRVVDGISLRVETGTVVGPTPALSCSTARTSAACPSIAAP